MNIRRITHLAAAAALLASMLGGCSPEAPETPSAGDVPDVSESEIIVEAEQASDSDIPGVEFGGHRYAVYDSGGADWGEIKEMCEEQGGYLAAIGSAEENEFLYELVQDSGFRSALFGFYRDGPAGRWEWLSGEDIIYLNWHEGEPNNSTGVEFYGMFYPGFENGQWNDGDKNDIEAFICEWD